MVNATKLGNGITTVIGPGVRIDGQVLFSGHMQLEGTVFGSVSVLPHQSGTLVLGQNARIKGDAQAPHLLVNGAIDGHVNSAESLRLKPGARINGDVHYLSIEMERGAIVEGQLVYHLETVRKQKEFEANKPRSANIRNSENIASRSLMVALLGLLRWPFSQFRIVEARIPTAAASSWDRPSASRCSRICSPSV